jgi:hypothetical protein
MGPIVKTNYCERCKARHPLTRKFWGIVKNPQGKEYLRCKIATAKYDKLYKAQPEQMIKDAERSRTMLRRYQKGKVSAKDRNKAWAITFEEYVEIVSRVCHYCGAGLSRAAGHCLDRIDNSADYTPDNVLPCCGDCNKMRNNILTVKEMEEAMRVVLALRKQVCCT